MPFLRKTVGAIVYPHGREGLSVASLVAACDAVPDEANSALPEGSFSRALQARADAVKRAAKLEQVPIVGVCGTVNSGKSTLVAGFLSEDGRRRVLVGELDAEGTHRFVFWLPASWRKNGLDGVVADMVRSATGIEPEDLAEDPAAAAVQYNAARDRVHGFYVPLLAYDERLDEAGIAFLDCADIQRSLDEATEEFTAVLRLERLKTIAPMCSAFVVVASMEQKGSEVVGKLFEAITTSVSEALLYFVLNKTKTDEVAKFLPEAIRTLDRWGMSAKVRRNYLSPFIHTDDPHARVSPVVTSMDDNRSRLEDLGKELDPAELQRQHRKSCVAHLKSLLEEVGDRTSQKYQEDRKLVVDARNRVCEFLAQKLIDSEGNPRALEFNEAARQMAESIQRTAPLGIRIAQAPGKWLRERFPKLMRRDASGAERESFARIKLTDFSGFTLGSRFLRPEVKAKALDKVWKQASDAVIAEGRNITLDPQEMDEMTRRMWKEIPPQKKLGLLINVAAAAAVIAVAGFLLPLDGGAFLALGGKEIVGTLLGGPLAGLLSYGPEAHKLVTKFERECARPQLDSLYAGLADGLGIPRDLDGLPKLKRNGKVCHEFQESKLATLPDLIGVLGHPLICLDETAWKEMMNTFTAEKP